MSQLNDKVQLVSLIAEQIQALDSHVRRFQTMMVHSLLMTSDLFLESWHLEEYARADRHNFHAQEASLVCVHGNKDQKAPVDVGRCRIGGYANEKSKGILAMTSKGLFMIQVFSCS